MFVLVVASCLMLTFVVDVVCCLLCVLLLLVLIVGCGFVLLRVSVHCWCVSSALFGVFCLVFGCLV